MKNKNLVYVPDWWLIETRRLKLMQSEMMTFFDAPDVDGSSMTSMEYLRYVTRPCTRRHLVGLEVLLRYL